jgi:hypothetical protein
MTLASARNSFFARELSVMARNYIGFGEQSGYLSLRMSTSKPRRKSAIGTVSSNVADYGKGERDRIRNKASIFSGSLALASDLKCFPLK